MKTGCRSPAIRLVRALPLRDAVDVPSPSSLKLAYPPQFEHTTTSTYPSNRTAYGFCPLSFKAVVKVLFGLRFAIFDDPVQHHLPGPSHGQTELPPPGITQPLPVVNSRLDSQLPLGPLIGRELPGLCMRRPRPPNTREMIFLRSSICSFKSAFPDSGG